MADDNTVTKADLAKCLVSCGKYKTQKEANHAIDSVIDCLEMNLKEGKEVSFIGFGKFSVSERSARTGKSPQTGKPIHIPATKSVSFKAGSKLKEAVNK